VLSDLSYKLTCVELGLSERLAIDNSVTVQCCSVMGSGAAVISYERVRMMRWKDAKIIR